MKHYLFSLLILFTLSSCKQDTIDLSIKKDALPEAINIQNIHYKSPYIYCVGGRDNYGKIYRKHIDSNWTELYAAEDKINVIIEEKDDYFVFLGDQLFGTTYDATNQKWSPLQNRDGLLEWKKGSTNLKQGLSIPNKILTIGGRNQQYGNIYFGWGLNEFNIEQSYQGTEALYDITRVSENKLLVCGYGTVIKYYIPEQKGELTDFTGEIFTSIDHYNTKTLMTSFSGIIYLSLDEGDNWFRVRNPDKLKVRKKNLHRIKIIDSQKAIAVGEKGAILYSNDGYETWKEVNYSGNEKLLCIATVEDKIYIGGSDGMILTVEQ